MSNIYESSVLTQQLCGSMHPGGLRLTDRAVRLAGLEEGMKVADIGCGTGATAAFLAEKYHLYVQGLEISTALVDIGLQAHPGLHLVPWDGEAFPFEENSLDAVFFECTLSVLKNSQQLLLKCAHALKEDGVIIISDIVLSQYARTKHHAPLTSEKLHDLLFQAGLTVIVHEDHTPALRTYVAELLEASGNTLDVCALLGSAGDKHRLADLGYSLIIARKI